MAIRNAQNAPRANGRPEGGSYRRFGNPDWDPSKMPPIAVAGSQRLANEQAQQRRQKYGALRSEGLSIADAAAGVGISVHTARKYEERRRRGLREAGAPC